MVRGSGVAHTRGLRAWPGALKPARPNGHTVLRRAGHHLVLSLPGGQPQQGVQARGYACDAHLGSARRRVATSRSRRRR